MDIDFMAQRPTTSDSVISSMSYITQAALEYAKMTRDDAFIRSRSRRASGRGEGELLSDDPAFPLPARPKRAQTSDRIHDGYLDDAAVGSRVVSPTDPNQNAQPGLFRPADATVAGHKSSKWNIFGRFGGKGSHSHSHQAGSVGQSMLDGPGPGLGPAVLTGRSAGYSGFIANGAIDGAMDDASEWQGHSGNTIGPHNTSRQKHNVLMRKGHSRSVKKGKISNPVSPPLPTRSKGRFLNVEIPSIKLDRYSVMFASILDPTKPCQTTRPGLLERRQSTLGRLMTVNEKLTDEPIDECLDPTRPRRVTSPQQSGTPSFSLFPATSTKTRDGAMVRPSTSPAHLLSSDGSSFIFSEGSSPDRSSGALTPSPPWSDQPDAVRVKDDRATMGLDLKSASSPRHTVELLVARSMSISKRKRRSPQPVPVPMSHSVATSLSADPPSHRVKDIAMGLNRRFGSSQSTKLPFSGPRSSLDSLTDGVR